MLDAMKHTLAHQTNHPDRNKIDKYLLSDLTHEDRLAFEEHMFDCPECAAEVKESFAMIGDLKTVLREEQEHAAQSLRVQPAKSPDSWRGWFRGMFQPVTLVPAFAAFALALVVGYQNLVSIPGMLQPQVIDTVPMVAATRGAANQVAAIKPEAAFFPLSFEVFSPSAYPGYVCEFLASGKSTATTMDCGKHSTAEFTLSLLLPSAKFPPGGYTMILRPASDKQAEISRYSFAVKNEDK
jgi:hypothetical protein